MLHPGRNERSGQIPMVVISLATTLAWGGLFVLPERISLALVCGLLFMVGVWSVLFPSRLLQWAKPTSLAMDPSDATLWWIPRLVGAMLIIISVIAVITTLY